MTAHRPRKSLGQHFLHDQNILGKIISAINPRADEHFVEIGPGQGALTRPLLARVGRLDAIELDRGLAATLPDALPDPRLRVHQGDALKFDFATLGPGPLRLAGNLPYNVSTPLLFHILASADRFTDIHVMLQKEVVDRMAAAPGGRSYGRLTVALAARCRVEPLFVIRPGSFTPPPRVDSAFVRLVPETSRLARVDHPERFDRLVARAFSQRRKQLANSLKTCLSAAQLRELGVDPAQRPEQLDVDTFIRLANAWQPGPSEAARSR